MNERALGLLGIARKGGFVQVGEDPVTSAIGTGHVRLMLVASNAGSHTYRRVTNLAAVRQTPVVVLENDKASLGAVFGRSSVAMVAVTDINLALHILSVVDQPDAYSEQLQAVREKAELMNLRKRTKPGTGKQKQKKKH